MNPDSTTPQPEEPPAAEDLEAELPGWSSNRPPLDQLDPNLTTVTELPPALPEGPTFDHDHDEERPGPTKTSPAPTSPRSDGDPPIASAAAGLFGLAATLAAFILNATIGRRSGAYLMRPEEAQSIGDPLGRIAARRAPVGDADVNDIGDGIQAGVATAAYAARATMQHFGSTQAGETA